MSYDLQQHVWGAYWFLVWFCILNTVRAVAWTLLKWWLWHKEYRTYRIKTYLWGILWVPLMFCVPLGWASLMWVDRWFCAGCRW